MNTCDTCKWWIEPKEGYDHRDMGTCENDKLISIGSDMLSAGEVWSSPCQPSTGPKFGCIHHELKS